MAISAFHTFIMYTLHTLLSSSFILIFLLHTVILFAQLYSYYGYYYFSYLYNKYY